MHKNHIYSLAVSLSAALFLVESVGASDDVGHVKVLREAGYDTDPAGLRKCLRAFSPDDESRRKAASLISQLGDADFQKREEASRQLKALPLIPADLIREAAKSNDPEVRLRATSVLKSRTGRQQRILEAALSLIADQSTPGIASELITAVENGGVQLEAKTVEKALLATVSVDETKLLADALGSTSPGLRAAACAGVAHLKLSEQLDNVKGLLSDANDRVRLAAAHAVTNLGSRGALEVYARLLLSEDYLVRWQSVEALRAVSGVRRDFAADQTAEARRAAGKAWLDWARNDGQRVKLNLPVRSPEFIRLFNGVDFSGWQAINLGKPTEAAPVWTVKDGIINCDGNARGYLRTKRSFDNYVLHVEWRWPAEAHGDGGVFIKLTGADATIPNGLEAQLLTLKAGDFWMLGGFTAVAGGVKTRSYAQKMHDSSEKEIGQWNRMELIVADDTVKIKVNGVLQNVATECRNDPGKIGLQVEGHAIQFRNIRLIPLK